MALRKRVCELYRANWSQRAIAKEVGLSNITVRRLLVASGVEVDRWRRVRRDGSWNTQWTGGRFYDQHGYVWVYVSDVKEREMFGPMLSEGRRCKEHRLVVARDLGRPLFKHEQVHHRNGIRDDNRPENLELRNGPHGSGAALCCAKCGSIDLVPTGG